MAPPKRSFESLPHLTDSATTAAAQLLSYISNRERAKILDTKRYNGVRQLLTFLDQHYHLPEGDETSLDSLSRSLGFPGIWTVDKSLIYAAVKSLRKETAAIQARPEYTQPARHLPAIIEEQQRPTHRQQEPEAVQPWQPQHHTLRDQVLPSASPSSTEAAPHPDPTTPFTQTVLPSRLVSPADSPDMPPPSEATQHRNRRTPWHAPRGRSPLRPTPSVNRGRTQSAPASPNRGASSAGHDSAAFVSGGNGDRPADRLSQQTEEIPRHDQPSRATRSAEPEMVVMDRAALDELMAQAERRAREAVRAELQAERVERKREDDIRHEEALEKTRADRLRRGGFQPDDPSEDDGDRRSHRSHHSRRSHRRDSTRRNRERERTEKTHNRSPPRRTRQRPDDSPSDSSSGPGSSARSPEPVNRRTSRHDRRADRYTADRDRERRHNREHDHRPRRHRDRARSYESYGSSEDEYIRRRRAEFKPEKIGYFDPYTKTPGVEMETRYGNRTYHSIHLFLQSARDQSRILDPQDVRDGLGQCLQGAAAEWHTHQLSETMKDEIRGGRGIKRWEALLLGKFKMSTTKALRLLDAEWFSFDSIRNNRSIAEFVTTVMRLAREAEFREDHVKLSQAWSRLEPSMRDVIPRPTTRTTVDEFIRICEEHEETWQEKAARYLGRYNQNTQQAPPQANGNRRSQRYDNRQTQQGRQPPLPYRTDQQQPQLQRPTYPALPAPQASNENARPNQRLLQAPNASTGNREGDTAGRGYDNRDRGRGVYSRGNNSSGGGREGQGYQYGRQENRAPQGGYFADADAEDRYADAEDDYREGNVNACYQNDYVDEQRCEVRDEEAPEGDFASLSAH